eukprot:3388679-Alexandrium_andersonii.AAC.1
MAVCVQCIEAATKPENKVLLEKFLTEHPPKSEALTAAIPCCRSQDMYGGSHCKIFVKLAPAYHLVEKA